MIIIKNNAVVCNNDYKFLNIFDILMNQLAELRRFPFFYRAKNIILNNLELLVWVSALCALYFMDMNSVNSFCVFKWIGIEFCPGCGIGHSINYALHLDFVASFKEHFFGTPALLIILHRIIQLIQTRKSNFK